MIYSVWNQGLWKYDYYQSPSVQDAANAPAPRHLGGMAQKAPIGLAPEQASWPLPPDAVKIGTGEYPRGRIATVARRRAGLMRGGGGAGASDGLGALSGIPVLEDLPLFAVIGLAAFGIWMMKR